ncbi:LytTR family DNA-binding domain-containing protein [Sphingomonas sp. LY54]|uniref:LytR/AlgR family response regulator transcription factor n=1 Tax=Sphingomonadales TaxID=204457 RepID=UPI002ADEC817|nr:MULTISPECIES: LytTR family DNA-binding domain-containing protein [Sphingomonadales]MEA1015023.1 LytTR family DNA-binding domain-containing protein [Sphingosinicella sp. LY1275]WRP29749.1 LytTR family DNA-binding domain-containing protein [Sphingomonas sp. LY54]
MRVLLVDDETLALDRLRTFFDDIEGVEVVGQAQDGDEALARIRELTPDLVILDVQMPGKNGLRAAAELDIEPRPELVFVTAHEHYAPDAFDVDAADYLLKPVRFDRLRQAVDRARRRQGMREQAERAGKLEQEVQALKASGVHALDDNGFWVPERDGQRRVPIDSIDWIEAARDYVLLHTDVRSHLLRTTMAALEEKLAGSALLRVHRSAFVRPDRVVEVKRANRSLCLVLADGAEVQVGPSYVSAVREALGLD